MTRRKIKFRSNETESDSEDIVRNSQEDYSTKLENYTSVNIKRAEIDPEVRALIQDIYDYHLKIFGEPLTGPVAASEPLRDEFRIIYHAINNAEKICAKALEKIRNDRKYQKIRDCALGSMKNVLEEAENKIEDLREETKRFKYNDPQQRSALALLQIRFEELALDSCGINELEDFELDGIPQSANALDKYSDCVMESFLNELVLRESDELFRLKELHAKGLEEIKAEERAIEKELSAVERQIKKARKICKYSSIAEEVFDSRRNEL